MVAPITHKILALGLAALLLVQYAPVVWLMDSGGHAASCTHCKEGFCLRHAKGHNAGETHAMRASAQGSMNMAPHSHTGGKPQFCTCNQGQAQVLSTVLVDKVVLHVPHGAEQPYALQTLLSAPDTLPVAHFAPGFFHPPRA